MQVPAEALPFCYVNGAIVPAEQAVISAFDRGFLVADGIFETFHVYQGVPLSFDAHLDRLVRSGEFMRLSLRSRRQEFAEAVVALGARNRLSAPGVHEAALRLTVSRGVTIHGPPTVTGYMRRLGVAHLAKRTEGVQLWTLPFRRDAITDLAQHKTLSYLASSLGQVLIAERTDDERAEGLFVTPEGDVLEGSSSNVFAVIGGQLVTPSVSDGLLPGTSRGRVIALAATLGIVVSERRLALSEFVDAAEVFVTSSTLHVAPVASLDGKKRQVGGPLTQRIAHAFDASIEREVEEFVRSRTLEGS